MITQSEGWIMIMMMVGNNLIFTTNFVGEMLRAIFCQNNV
jgi:hypothetical protein